jgi:hypothetical protein
MLGGAASLIAGASAAHRMIRGKRVLNGFFIVFSID